MYTETLFTFLVETNFSKCSWLSVYRSPEPEFVEGLHLMGLTDISPVWLTEPFERGPKSFSKLLEVRMPSLSASRNYLPNYTK